MQYVSVCMQHSSEQNFHVNKVYSSIRIFYSKSTSCLGYYFTANLLTLLIYKRSYFNFKIQIFVDILLVICV